MGLKEPVERHKPDYNTPSNTKVATWCDYCGKFISMGVSCYLSDTPGHEGWHYHLECVKKMER